MENVRKPTLIEKQVCVCGMQGQVMRCEMFWDLKVRSVGFKCLVSVPSSCGLQFFVGFKL